MILYMTLYMILYDIILIVWVHLEFRVAARYARWSGLDAHLWAFDHSFFQRLFQVVSIGKP
jgi:hypothetical protein